jgi:Spy/CpxP family protein refolding chaperone
MFARLLLASALAVGLASAQGGQKGGGDMGGMGGGGMGGDASGAMGGGMPRAQRQSRADIIADKLHLNKDQKEQASKIFAAAQEEAAPLSEQVRTGRSAITTAILQGTSKDDIDKMMAQFTDLMAQKTAVEVKAYGKLYAILDAKQQAKAAPVFAEQMDGMFEGGGRGRGGNRGGEPR